MKKILTLIFCIVGLSCLSLSTYAELPVQALTHKNVTLSKMLKKAMPAVVNIVSQGEIPLPTNKFLRREMQEQQPSSKQLPKDNHFSSVGSGVIVDPAHGLIITNAHVVSMAKNITVTLNDGRHFQAVKIGEDDETDIAVIQIPGKNLVGIPYGDSNKVKIGDFVAAIGSPLGLRQSVSSGIVSALHRSDLGLEGFENFIQTDAPINMGNSGGALVNMQGELIGINTALLSSNGGNIGIGFAIPSDMARSVAQQLVRFGKVQRGLMGVMVQTLTPDLAESFKIPHVKGAIVTRVVPYSPASKAGMKIGDVILKINGEKVTSSDDVQNIIGLLRIGSKVNLVVLRDGKQYAAQAITENPTSSEIKDRMSNPYLYGVQMQNITQEIPGHGYTRGVQIIHIDEYSPAWTAALKRGDIVISANRKKISTIDELTSIAKSNKKGLLLEIIRNKGAAFVVIK